MIIIQDEIQYKKNSIKTTMIEFREYILREKRPNSGPYFSVFGPNTGKYEPEKTPYLETFT